MRCTLRREIPTALAMARTVQWVASPGGSSWVSSTTRLTKSAGNGGLPGGRVLSYNSPSTRSSMNRACQRHTVGLVLPVRRMISMVPKPSAVKSTIRARQTCF
jgi:hypothetical protein